MEKEKIIPAAPEEADITPDTVVKFTRSYSFEGKSYSEVDLAGMDDLTAKDMMEAEKYLFKTGTVSALPDQAVGYVCFIASKISDQPIEFVHGPLPQGYEPGEEQGDRFFLRRGMRTGDGALFRRLCVRLSTALRSDYHGFTNTPSLNFWT